jgi:ribosomal protein L11 methyltransferase
MLPVTWLVTFKTDHYYLKYFIDHLSDLYSDVSYFEHKTSQYIEHMPDDVWVVQLYFKQQPKLEEITQNIIKITEIYNIPIIPKLEISNIKDRDWIASIKKKSKPIAIDQFCIYNSHHKLKDNKLIPIIIDPTRAFGTGEHYTTKNCIKALCYLYEFYNYKPEKMLDIGCGSGILAIAMAKLWKKHLIAADIDKQSVITTNENTKLNKVDHLITVFLSDGYNCHQITKNIPYDLITCNILAQPLISMATDLSKHLKVGGKGILSGFLINQEQQVINAHEAQSLKVIHRIVEDNWSTLIVEKLPK